MNIELKKAWEILEKINNGKISKALWDNCSDYAKSDLKRKAFIIIDMLVEENKLFPYNTIFYERIELWKNVRSEVEKL